MTAFHTIAIPHDDILQGRLTMDVFAADLWDVYKNHAIDEYKSPDLFFQKTYKTEGLKTILDVVKSRLMGNGGDPVLQLQTPFGGGKTHALIAMYHKAAEWGAKRVVMVGTSMDAKDTLWGLIEEQLTGKCTQFTELTSPGRSEKFRKLLADQGPILILFDELLEYITKSAGVKVAESTLASQSIAFIQELTELVSTLDKVVYVVTLPSSLMEHFDEHSEELFQKLQRVSGRVEKIYTPIQENEITQVIRCRLFNHVDTRAANKEISNFIEYASRESLLPAGVEPSEYRQRFEASYPFLPDVVDVLYQRWGSYSTFQRTRGVLRLLALVVYSLKDKNIPYISLGDFDLSNQEIRRELLKHIGAEFDSVIAADITSPDAGSKKVNNGLGKAYQGLRLGDRVTTATFMYSFSGGVERGATMVEIKRNATTLENPSAVVAEAVEELKGRLFYIQNQTGKYFFSNQANLNRMLLTRMENIHEADIKELEEAKLHGQIKGDKLRVSIWKDQSNDIPDTPDLKLIILSSNNQKVMKSILEEKGNTPRVHRNTMFFLVPLESERMAFYTLLRRQIAFDGLSRDPTLKLTSEHYKEIKDNLKRLEGDVEEGIRRLYRQIYLPIRNGWKEVDLGLPTVGDIKPLDQEIYERLRLDGEILEKVAPLVIKEKYLQDREWVSTSQLYQASLKTPGESRTLNQSAWEIGFAEGVKKGLFGLGELIDEKPVCRFFKNDPSISFVENEILIAANVCEAQITEKAAEETVNTFSEGKSSEYKPVLPIPGTTPDVAPRPESNKFQQLTFDFVVPKGKVSNLMGVLNYLQSKYGQIHMHLNVDQGSLTEQEYEDKVKEAFRQMGINIE